jgi:hypothetical protein
MNKIPRPHMPTVLDLGRKTRASALSPSLGFFGQHRQSNLPPHPLNVASPPPHTSCFSSRLIFVYPNSGFSLDVRRKAPFNFVAQPFVSFALYAYALRFSSKCRQTVCAVYRPPETCFSAICSLCPGLTTFFQAPPLTSSLPSISSASVRLSRVFSR